MSATDPPGLVPTTFALARALAIVFAILAAISLPALRQLGASPEVAAAAAWALFAAAVACAVVMLASYWRSARVTDS